METNKNRIDNDKYYTPIEIANRCWQVVDELFDVDTFSEIVEPSCGEGAFFHYRRVPDVGIDIRPELGGGNIVTADWLEYDIQYKKGRLVIGNPPFGSRMYMAQSFFRKAVKVADVVAFILPISQLGNTHSLCEFDLIKSVDIGKMPFSGRTLHCCFNVYSRPKNGMLNKRPVSRLKSVKIVRNDSRSYPDAPYDFRMCAWGDGTAGKVIPEGESYSAEYKIKVSDTLPYRDEVLDYIKNYDWKGTMKAIAMRKIQQFHIIDIIKKKFPDIE